MKASGLLLLVVVCTVVACAAGVRTLFFSFDAHLSGHLDFFHLRTKTHPLPSSIWLAPTQDFFGTTKHEKVLMKDVTALTLRKGEMTTGRRSSPVPQVRQRPLFLRVSCVSCVILNAPV
jgi:hypothetical protein